MFAARQQRRPGLRFAAALVVAGMCALTCTALPAGAIERGRDDYANVTFATPLRAGLRAFFTRDFPAARTSFERALTVIPDNTLAISFLNATAMQTPGGLAALIDTEEDTLGKQPKAYLAHVRLGFSYVFDAQSGRDRDVDARAEFDAAVALAPDAPAAHVGLGIMRENARSKNRAKVELFIALQGDENDVLAREYLALIYADDLKDPQRGLAYIIDIPNVLPEYADIDYHIASLLDDLGQSDAAIVYATRGLETDIGHVGEAGQHGYTLLAHIYLRQKRLPDARRVLTASIAADADAAYATTLLHKLDRGDYAPHASPAPSAKR